MEMPHTSSPHIQEYLKGGADAWRKHRRAHTRNVLIFTAILIIALSALMLGVAYQTGAF